ncbi:alpha/beta hydrolase [Magnetospirillum gryphiswaldense]|uniref:Esterase/lipase n=1 Tax=Magnetospirillum gryphiswaldense TaxID=55518 RepID=A4TYX0_9PROT|nr:alpha/beta hydrolase [Magnetospirillum gryphiswaldense]AVM74176.1 Acetyl esterase [Magnetospirillum gryphiswaldense MSR-1]AVM78079.1 Acetyl esterase [Magnetospirillum gryphiswaldense]CAM75827.1 Esterase/lipase [Magnetospirillum gryphiswaldense MSR-1]
MTSSPALSLIQAHAARHGAAPADPLRQTLAEARASALAYQGIWNHDLPPLARRQDITADGLRLRLLDSQPQGPSRRPVLLYFHGGGFALNSVDTHERLLRLLAQRSGAAVLALGYSLAPEARFPRQVDEALAAIAWVRAHGADFGLDGNALAVGGDSAGANLALAAMLRLRDQRLPQPRLGVLLYGMFSADLLTASHQRFGGGQFGLTTERVDWFWSQYLADFAQRDNPLAAPLLADLHGLPPQLVIGAGLDCLLDDSLALAEKLRRVGIPHQLSVYDGVPHSFMQMSAVLDQAQAAIDETARALAEALMTPQLQAAE